MSSQFINFLDDMDLLMPPSSQQQQQSGVMSTLIMPSVSYSSVFAAGGSSNSSSYLFNSNPDLSSTYKTNGQQVNTASCLSSSSHEMDPCLSHSMDPLILMDSSPPPPPAPAPAQVDSSSSYQPLPSIDTLSINTFGSVTHLDLPKSGQFMVVNPIDQVTSSRFDFASSSRQQPAPLVSQQSLPLLLHPTTSTHTHGQPGSCTGGGNTVMSPSVSSVSSCSSFSSYSAVSTSSSSGSSAAKARPPGHAQHQAASFAHRSSLPLPLFGNALNPAAVNRPNSIQQYDLMFDRIDAFTGETNLNSSYRDERQNSVSQPDEFQIDDFNLPTPTTTDDKSLVSHSSLSTPPPVLTCTSTTASTSFDEATPSSSSSKLNLPLLDQLNLSSTYSHSNSFFLNSSSSSHFSPASFVTNAATGQLGFVSRSNSQPDLTLNLDYSRLQPSQSYATSDSSSSNYHHHHQSMMLNKSKTGAISRHPSLTCKTSISEFDDNDDFFNTFNVLDYLSPATSQQGNTFQPNSSNSVLSNTSTGVSSTGNFSSNPALPPQSKNYGDDDNIFLGTDAISDFLNNCGTFSELLDNLPDIEDYMSLVTFETAANLQASQPAKQTLCDLALPSSNTNNNACGVGAANGMMLSSCFNDDSRTDRSKLLSGGSNQAEEGGGNFERVTRSAPPSPTPQRKKQRPTANNLPWQKAWSKMDDEEQSKIIEFLTRIINDEMGFREQLEIIRILNADVKLKPADTQFIIDLKMIDDEKFRRIKEVIKLYGLSLNEKPLKDNSSDCSANSCPQDYQMLKRELRLKRAQQRLKLKQKKDHRQTVKESKSGLFNKTEVVPLSQALPEEDIDIDVLS